MEPRAAGGRDKCDLAMVLLRFYPPETPSKEEAHGRLQGASKSGPWERVGGGRDRGGAPKRGVEGIGSASDVHEWLQKYALAIVSCESLPAAYFQEPVRGPFAGAKK